MVKPLRNLFVVSAVSLISMSHAGTYYLESISEIGYTSGSLGPLTFSEMKNINGHTITHRTILSDWIGGNWNATSGTLWDVRVRIRWEEDYPGEPKPSTVDLVWDAASTGRNGYPLGHPFDSSTAAIMFLPTGGFVPSADYSGGTSGGVLITPGGPVIANNQTCGGVTFGWQGGDWIGIGDIALAINASLSGSVFTSSFYASDNSLTMTLKKTLAGDPIL